MADVKTLEVQGVELSIDVDRFGDIEVFDAMAAVAQADESGDETQALVAGARWMHAVLGADYRRVTRELRARSEDGIVTVEQMSAFCTDLLKAAKAKN